MSHFCLTFDLLLYSVAGKTIINEIWKSQHIVCTYVLHDVPTSLKRVFISLAYHKY